MHVLRQEPTKCRDGNFLRNSRYKVFQTVSAFQDQASFDKATNYKFMKILMNRSFRVIKF